MTSPPPPRVTTTYWLSVLFPSVSISSDHTGPLESLPWYPLYIPMGDTNIVDCSHDIFMSICPFPDGDCFPYLSVVGRMAPKGVYMPTPRTREYVMVMWQGRS